MLRSSQVQKTLRCPDPKRSYKKSSWRWSHSLTAHTCNQTADICLNHLVNPEFSFHCLTLWFTSRLWPRVYVWVYGPYASDTRPKIRLSVPVIAAGRSNWLTLSSAVYLDTLLLITAVSAKPPSTTAPLDAKSLWLSPRPIPVYPH